MSLDRNRAANTDAVAREPHRGPIMAVNEAAEAFPGEWIFMQVTEQDEHGHAAAGIVLAHDRERRALVEMEIAMGKSPPPGTRAFYTYKGPRFTTTAAWKEYLERKRATREHGS